MSIYVNADSLNLGFPYLNLLGEAQWKKLTCILYPFYSHCSKGPCKIYVTKKKEVSRKSFVVLNFHFDYKTKGIENIW